jgi:LuxR family maltose regulon positive regulatory protein
VAGLERRPAWLSLDEGDNEPGRFLTYLIAALQTIVPTLGNTVLAGIPGPQPPAPSVLAALVNEISTVPESFVLVLDDYHVIDATAVDLVLTFLLEHVPAQMHLVISTRQDPNLPLARLRAGGHLTEVRAADLRFTPAEAAEFLNSVMGLSLSPHFFVVALDDPRHWYRYHHLFAEVLRAYLTEEQPDRVSTLHRRASEWYELNGSPANAIRHALAAADFEHVADLIERAGPAMQRNRQEATLLGWLRALPDQVFHHRPVLSAAYGGVLLANGELEGVESRLRDAERWLDAPADPTARPDAQSAEMVVVDETEFHRLPAQIAVWRAGIAQVIGRGDDTVRYARRALDLVGADDHLVRGAAVALIGLASWAVGDLEAAYQMYAESIVELQRVGKVSDVLGCSIALADIRIAQGCLREAMSIHARGLRLATEQGSSMPRGAADMYVGMSELHREHGDLGAATQLLARSRELGESNGLPQNRYRSAVALARIREAEGNLDGAVELLDEAERVYANDFSPKVRPVAAMRTRVLARPGNS